eukprot:CAMPEP_0184041930 /NCGR_PEP_ID=MMETSP0955-20130417/64856_1 /TAXON_ID=627963 /ORGANISM="Aplanochytrium sp, Strain PBS07" /LENGTH=73 /DNA_ID=CAMNT_0026332511 /DNA_START=218 /DNA_END=436 /DNA_ORIENTATION=-
MNSLFVLSVTSREVLIEKHWKEVASRNYVDLFWQELSKGELPQDILPVLPAASNYLINVYKNNLFFLSVVTGE